MLRLLRKFTIFILFSDDIVDKIFFFHLVNISNSVSKFQCVLTSTFLLIQTWNTIRDCNSVQIPMIIPIHKNAKILVNSNKNSLTQIRIFAVHGPVWGPTNSWKLFRNANHLLEIASVSTVLFLNSFLVWMICEITLLNSP